MEAWIGEVEIMFLGLLTACAQGDQRLSSPSEVGLEQRAYSGRWSLILL